MEGILWAVAVVVAEEADIPSLQLSLYDVRHDDDDTNVHDDRGQNLEPFNLK